MLQDSDLLIECCDLLPQLLDSILVIPCFDALYLLRSVLPHRLLGSMMNASLLSQCCSVVHADVERWKVEHGENYFFPEVLSSVAF